jgi:uncharacterized protein YndB with AHSA1/START domain
MAELIREILIDATPATVFGFLSDAEKWAQWEGTELEIDARPGGIYRVVVGQDEWKSRGEFVEVVPNEKVVYTFGWEDEGNPIRPGSTTVEMTLQPDGDKTLLRVVHRGLPDESFEDHGRGWDHYLARLAVVAAGGDPGPDPGPGG